LSDGPAPRNGWYANSATPHGGGLAWHEHNGRLFCGTRRVFRPAYDHHLINEWLPSLEGVVPKLQRGSRTSAAAMVHRRS
jgi:hypothetical protein